MSLAQPIPHGEYCPNCGGWATSLSEDLGWCLQCSAVELDKKICTTCGALFDKAAQVDKCWNCRKEEWLNKHADKIEAYMIMGVSFSVAMERVRQDIRPHCQRCNEEIRGGKEGDKFCNKKPECRKAARYYRELRQTGLSPDVSMAIASGRVTLLSN